MNIQDNFLVEEFVMSACNTSFVILENRPKKNSIKLEFEGEIINPKEITESGTIWFSEEQKWHFGSKVTYKNEPGFYPGRGNKIPTFGNLIVTYEPIEIHSVVPREAYDSVEGIEQSLESMETFKEMLLRRAKMTGENTEFVLFGYIGLSGGAVVRYKQDDFWLSYIANGDVCQIRNDERGKRMLERYIRYYPYKLPVNNENCPCCGKPFTMEDIRKGNLKHKYTGKSKREFYHVACLKETSVD